MYEVVTPFGQYKKGQLLDPDKRIEGRIIRRKLQEGDTVKVVKQEYQSKMKRGHENKGGPDGCN